MLRALLVRAAAGTLVAAIAISCSHEDAPVEKVGQVEQLAAVGGAGGAPDILPDAGAPADGGAPVAGNGGAGGDASPPYICGENDCLGACEQCVANVCLPRLPTFECRGASGGPCDAPEHCDGINPTCPTEEEYLPEGTLCGNPKQDLCDEQDTCDGQSKACVDRVTDANTPCRGVQGVCDVADKCDGKSSVCADEKQPTTLKCQTAKVTDLCDIDDYCDGKTNDCKDTFKSSNFVCRPSLIGSDGCDPAESCTGTDAACPIDVRTDNTTSCIKTTTNKCALTAECQNGLCVPSTFTSCQPPEQCQKAGSCNPATGKCEYPKQPNDTACDDGVECTDGDKCVNGVCASGTKIDAVCADGAPICATAFCDPTVPSGCRYDATLAKGSVCRKAVAGGCDVADKCNGVDLDCPVFDEHRPVGTVCVAGACGNNEMQPEATCDGSAFCPVTSKVSCDGYGCDDTKSCKTSCETSADCITSHYCLDHVCEKRVDAGKPCEQDAECATGSFCVDGVCCNTQCKGQCEACNLEGKEGVCELVTGDPVGDRTPCKGDGSSCNGTCDGTKRGQCTFPSVQTQCQDAACDATSGMAVEQAFCDGAGNCAATDPTDCAPYLCGATACRGDCVSDAQCVSGSFCKAGKCIPLEEPGTACARDAQCASGFCADGVCCDSRCDGQCEACGKSGTCAAVSGAPLGNRPACAGSEGECAGSCDGENRTACSYPGASVVCRDAGCQGSVATVAAHCSGDGRCAEPQTVTCPNGCEGVLCAGDACAVSTDCNEGERCVAGTCAPQGDDGAVCSSAADCGSGFCVDGVCCDRACDGQCEACDGKKPGVCAAVSGEPHGGRARCTSDGSACGGSCDGKSALGCSYPSGTVCAGGSCEPGQDGGEAVATVESQCNGSGRCPAQREQACGSAGCDPAEQLCDGDCADGSACGEGKYCSAGVCVDALPTGDACQTADQCASGFCVDGYCCGSACDDTCAACDVAGSLGKCVPVSGPTHGGRNACRGAGACGATCDGKSVTACAFADEDTSCGGAYCQAGVKVAASACDGAGQCRAGESLACPSLSCDGDECSDSCSTDADCSRSLQCREGKCVEPYLINAVDEGTCGCRVPGGAPARRTTGLAALALVALVVGRRRSRRAA